MPNINDNFFDGNYKDIWKTIVPEQLTVKETEFMLSWFSLEKEGEVLDLMCGYGRHAIALAKQGMRVTAVDNLTDYIDEVKRIAESEQLSVTPVLSDVLQFSTAQKFDLALCMGNSINFFDQHDTQQLLKNIASFLKPRGHLLINSWSLAEITFRNFSAHSESKAGDMTFVTDSQFLFHPTRVEVESHITDANGNTEIKKGVDYIFSVNEMESMISEAGLVLQDIFSIPGRKKFTLSEPRAYIIAEKK